MIRPARRDEVRAVVQMMQDDEMGGQRERLVDELPDGYMRAFEIIDQDPRNHLLVAELDGQLVGAFQLIFIPSISYQGGTRAQIESVRVVQQLRGQGVGRQMMLWAIERSRQEGCVLVQLSSHQSRTRAHSFYQQLGFSLSHQGMKLIL